jgi:hypothetical protein
MDFRRIALPAGVAALLGVAALVTGIGRASPSSFALDMNGFHSAAEPPETFTFGFRHEGPFTASASFCSSGYGVDLKLVPYMALRQFTCSDGSGTITAQKLVVQSDALYTHEEDVWSIVEGTGRYSTLRGKGTAVSDVVSGDPAKHTSRRRSAKSGAVLWTSMSRLRRSPSLGQARRRSGARKAPTTSGSPSPLETRRETRFLTQ